MNFRAFISGVLILGVAGWLDPAYCDELSERAAIQKEVVSLLDKGEYARLDALADGFLKSRARTPSGVWKLTVYYSGVARVFNSSRQDEASWARSEEAAGRWVRAQPKSSAARLSQAQMLLSRGWSYRGRGHAFPADPQQMKRFQFYTQQARSHLEVDKQIASRDPHWYVLMARVAVRQGWPVEEFSALIEEGLRREPAFYQTYFAAVDYYAPRWGGNAAAIEKFARAALERTRSTEGSGMYARIYWYLSQSQYGERLFTDSMADWPLMKAGLDDVVRRYPDSWNLNSFARFACLARDKAKTAELVGRLGGNAMKAVWRDVSNFERCKAWALQ